MKKEAGLTELRATAEPSVPPVKTEYYHTVPRWKVYEERGGAYRAESVCETLCHRSKESTSTWWADGKLVKKEAGLRAQHGTLCSPKALSLLNDGKL